MGGGYSQNVGLELTVASGQLLILTIPPIWALLYTTYLPTKGIYLSRSHLLWYLSTHLEDLSCTG
jgi:hypothetical protein